MVPPQENQRIHLTRVALAIVAMIIVIATIVWALTVVGTPGSSRQRRLDEARIDDLQEIYRAIDRFHSNNGTLPESLDRLTLEQRYLEDPDSGEPYGYEVIAPNKYQLSATFMGAETVQYYYGDVDWNHPKGLHRFTITVPDSTGGGSTGGH